jgi:hypothetical protein
VVDFYAIAAIIREMRGKAGEDEDDRGGRK